MWTIETELMGMAGKSSVEEAICALGIGRRGAELVPVRDWYLSGGESYIYRFEVSEAEHRLPLVLKSYVSSGGNLAGGFAELLGRRKLLSEQGAQTPRLYGAKDATVLEEYIPYSLDEVLDDKGPRLGHLVRELVRLGKLIDRLGFFPVTLLRDLRSRGNDVVVVDFGSDLGGPGNPDASTRAVDEVFRYLERGPLHLSRAQTDILARGVHQSEPARTHVRGIRDAESGRFDGHA